MQLLRTCGGGAPLQAPELLAHAVRSSSVRLACRTLTCRPLPCFTRFRPDRHSKPGIEAAPVFVQRYALLCGPPHASLLWDVAHLLRADALIEPDQPSRPGTAAAELSDKAAGSAAAADEDVDVLSAEQDPGSEAQQQALPSRPHPAASALAQAWTLQCHALYYAGPARILTFCPSSFICM